MAFENLGNETDIEEAFQTKPLITAEKIKQIKANIDAECRRRNKTVTAIANGTPGGISLKDYPDKDNYKYVNGDPTSNSLLKKEYKEKAALLMNAISGKNYQVNGQIASQNDFINMAVDVTLYNEIGENEKSPAYSCTNSTCTGLCYSCTGTCAEGCSGSCTGDCKTTCTGTCKGCFGCSGCGGGCTTGCTGDCDGCSGCGSGCEVACASECQEGGACGMSCWAKCARSCTNDCSGGCTGYCDSNCGSACYGTCGGTSGL